MSEPIGRLAPRGPSGKGWSYYSPFLTCPRKFHFIEAGMPPNPGELVNFGRRGQNGDPRHFGSLFHIAAAQHYLLRRDGPVSGWASPEAAILSEPNQDPAVQQKVLSLIGVYRQAFSKEVLEVIDVEKIYETTFGAAPYTARIDLVSLDSRGRVWFYDYKTTSAKIDKAFFRGFRNSGQFIGQAVLGKRHHGANFGGIIIKAISKIPPFKMEQDILLPCPQLEAQFPVTIAQAGARIEALSGLSATTFWPAVMNDQICSLGKYGPCDYYGHCVG